MAILGSKKSGDDDSKDNDADDLPEEFKPKKKAPAEDQVEETEDVADDIPF